MIYTYTTNIHIYIYMTGIRTRVNPICCILSLNTFKFIIISNICCKHRRFYRRSIPQGQSWVCRYLI